MPASARLFVAMIGGARSKARIEPYPSLRSE